ncbi:14-3-3 domain-containing protein [Tanacetum coccineum]
MQRSESCCLGYKNVFGAKRASGEILSAIKSKKEASDNTCYVALVNESQKKVENELTTKSHQKREEGYISVTKLMRSSSYHPISTLQKSIALGFELFRLSLRDNGRYGKASNIAKQAYEDAAATWQPRCKVFPGKFYDKEADWGQSYSLDVRYFKR